MDNNELVYKILLKIRQKECTPAKIVNVTAIYIDLCFKGIPTYRRIRDVLNQSHKILLEGFDRDDKPEFYKSNDIGDTSVVIATNPFWDI